MFNKKLVKCRHAAWTSSSALMMSGPLRWCAALSCTLLLKTAAEQPHCPPAAHGRKTAWSGLAAPFLSCLPCCAAARCRLLTKQRLLEAAFAGWLDRQPLLPALHAAARQGLWHVPHQPQASFGSSNFALVGQPLIEPTKPPALSAAVSCACPEDDPTCTGAIYCRTNGRTFCPALPPAQAAAQGGRPLAVGA